MKTTVDIMRLVHGCAIKTVADGVVRLMEGSDLSALETRWRCTVCGQRWWIQVLKTDAGEILRPRTERSGYPSRKWRRGETQRLQGAGR